MKFWQKVKNALVSGQENDGKVETRVVPNTKPRAKHNFDLINEWLQFCIEHDKKITEIFEGISAIVVHSIAEHFPVLRTKRKQFTYTDDYGILQDDGWFQEVHKFTDTIISPRLESLKAMFFTWHKTALKEFANLYNTLLPEEEPLNAQYGTYYGFLVEDLEVFQETLDDLQNIFLEHEKYAKTHKNNKKCQKFLFLKKHQILGKNSDYTVSFKAHICLTDVFCCLLQIPDSEKSKNMIEAWTPVAFYAFHDKIDLDKIMYEYIIKHNNSNRTSPQESDYSFLFDIWLYHNINLLFTEIFNKNPNTNKEYLLMGYHSLKFGNKKIQKTKTPKTGFDYEKIITNKLKELGFNAKTTKASGDQGADILAEKEGVSFAIQCKMYTKPVGNKAVQEVNAARDFYGKDYAVVVSNAGYTKSARTAANACDVILINDTQLEKLLEYV